MPAELEPSSGGEPPSSQAPSSGANDALSVPPRPPWGWPQRKRVLTWTAISFFAPIPFLLLLRVPLKPKDSLLTLQAWLPAKAVVAIAVVIATWVVASMEKRPLADFGAPPRQAFGVRFWEGFAWGFAALSAILLVLHASGHFQIDSAALAGPAVLRYALGWGLAFLAVAYNEEFAFRGYLLFLFSRRFRFWRGALYLSLIFAAVHLPNPGENALGIFQVALIGLIFCLTIRRTGTLWFAVGFHAAWDWAQTFFYGTPDSGLLGVGRFLNTSVRGPGWLTGGTAGPEGSVIAVFVLLLVALLIHLRFPKAVYADRPL